MVDTRFDGDQFLAQVGGAVLRLLDETRYESLSVEDLAARIGVRPDEIYQRWASKPDLVVAVIRRSLTDLTVPDHGDVRKDLVEFTSGWQAKANTELAPLLHAMITRLHDSRDVAVAYQAVSLYLEESLGTILRRGVARGAVPADAPVGLAIEVLRARVWYRFIRNWPLDEQVAAETIDRAILPILAHG